MYTQNLIGNITLSRVIIPVAALFIFVLLGKNIGRQTATRIHEQRA